MEEIIAIVEIKNNKFKNYDYEVISKARKIAKELYKKAEKSLEGSIERKYVDSLLDWY